MKMNRVKGVIIKFILTRNLSNVQFAPIDVVVVMLSMVTCVSIQVCTIDFSRPDLASESAEAHY